jgi:glycosyltransferase involved in cell wall biosynthesis
MTVEPRKDSDARVPHRGRLNVLIVASMCHPDRGSEPGLGWKWSTQIARHHDVTVIVGEYEENRAAIARELASNPQLASAMKFEFVPWFEVSQVRWQRAFASVYQPLYYAWYEQWMRRAQKVAEGLLAGGRRFDIAHQLTMIGFREPGFLQELPIPFVWGPVGGTQNVPWRLLPALGAVEGTRHGCRNVINEWQKRRHRRSREAFQRAAAIIAVATDTQQEIRRHHGVDSRVIAAALCEPGHPRSRVRKPHDGPTRFVFTGLHLSRKGLPFALRALARLPKDIDWTLDVMGSGPQSTSWKRLTDRLGLTKRVTFHGYASREKLMDVLDGGDVYLFPSLLEGWPAAIAEALTLGLPVVTTDLHGMSDMVTDECGRLVSATSPARLVSGFADACMELARSPDLVERLSRGALQRAEVFGSDVQVPLILETYEAALAAARPRAVASP